MAAVEHDTKVVVVAIASKVESLRRYLVRRVADGIELDTLVTLALEEDTREVHFLVVCIELAVVLRVGEKALPSLTDHGGALEKGRLRREA
jgi:hypothetical protein